MNDKAPPQTKEEKLEQAIDKGATREMVVHRAEGTATVMFQTMSEMMEFSKTVALAGIVIPAVFRNNPGACLAVTMQANRWGQDAIAVMNKTYVVKGRSGEEKLAYEAQLIHAIVNSRAPLQRRLRVTYHGEGAALRCKVEGWLKGESEPALYESPEIGQIGVKNSPLWASDPRQQLHYYSSRAWARRHVPEVLLGIFTADEIESQDEFRGPDNARDVTPRTARPSAATVVEGEVEPPANDEPEEPEQAFEFYDGTGTLESTHPIPEGWAKEFVAACGDPKHAGAHPYCVANIEAAIKILPLIGDDALAGKVQAIIENPPAKIEPKPDTPRAADGAAGQTKTDAVKGPAVAEPAAAAQAAKEEGPKAVEYPKTDKGRPHHAKYMDDRLAELALCTRPEHVDMVMAREAPNLAGKVIMAGTKRSIEMAATRRKGQIAAEMKIADTEASNK